MIVKKLVKKNNIYYVSIDDKVYPMDEEVIVKYRLVQGKEISENILEEALQKNDIASFYNKALNYAIQYGKSQQEVYDYLFAKGLKSKEITEIIKELNRVKVLDDERLISSMTDSLVRKCNGKLLIERKLKEHKFSPDLITKALEEMDKQLYLEALNRLYDKIKDKYKDEPYVKKMKIKRYLLTRGYTYEDIGHIPME